MSLQPRKRVAFTCLYLRVDPSCAGIYVFSYGAQIFNIIVSSVREDNAAYMNFSTFP